MSNESFTGKTPAETYTKIVQITADNELLDGVGGEISPIFKAGATVEGALDVTGTITQNGIPLNSTTGIWNVNDDNEATIANDVGIGTTNPENAKLQIQDDGTQDFFLIKKSNEGIESTVMKVDDEKLQMHGNIEIKQEGFLKFEGTETIPDVVAGGMYYNKQDKEFYLGYDE